MEWYLKVMRDNYANFSGRARRKEYWMFSLFFFIVAIAAAILAAVMGAIVSVGLGEEVGIAVIVGVMIIFYLAHIIPAIAVTVRRLHDTGNSGWLYLIALIPYLGNLILFIFTLIDGQKGENKWGSNPKEV